MSRRWLRGALVAALGATLAGGVAAAMRLPANTGGHAADAEDKTLVGLGKRVYAAHCASCHGRYLQGQPLWQAADADSARRAPALDQTGHSWLRGDAELFRIVKFSAAGSSMPAFAARLGDGDILAAVAFIKARWPIGMRVAQSAFNPGMAGLPRGAASSAWRFPAMCRSGV